MLDGYNIEQCISIAKELGYDAIDICTWEPHLEPRIYGKRKRKELLELARSYDIEIGQIVTFGWECSEPIAALRAATIKYMKERLELAWDLEAKCVEYIPGWTRPDLPREKTWRWAVEVYKKVVKYAEDVGIPIAAEFEPLQPWMQMWGKPRPLNVHTIDLLVKFASELGSDYSKVNLDLGHCYIAKATYDDFKKVKEYVIYTHCNDNDGVTDLNLPPGRGKVPFATYFRWLHEIGYDGFIGIELEGVENSKDLAKESYEYVKSILVQLGFYGTYKDPFRRD
jgi:protein FrlC